MGSPLGILIESGGVPPRAYLGEGLVTYLTTPARSFGALAGLLGLRSLARSIVAARWCGWSPWGRWWRSAV